MKPKLFLDQVVAKINEVGAGDPSAYEPYASLWDAIKVAIQEDLDDRENEYQMALVKGVRYALDSLEPSVFEELREELNAGDEHAAVKAIFTRLLARGRKEKVRFAPVDFYFYYFVDDLTIYGRALERSSLMTVTVNAFSVAAPWGETGDMYIHRIAGRITQVQFELAREMKWPPIDRFPI